MIITGKKSLLQIKKFAVAYLIVSQKFEKDSAKFPGEKSLFYDMQNEETELFIKMVDDELNAIHE